MPSVLGVWILLILTWCALEAPWYGIFCHLEMWLGIRCGIRIGASGYDLVGTFFTITIAS